MTTIPDVTGRSDKLRQTLSGLAHYRAVRDQRRERRTGVGDRVVAEWKLKHRGERVTGATPQNGLVVREEVLDVVANAHGGGDRLRALPKEAQPSALADPGVFDGE